MLLRAVPTFQSLGAVSWTGPWATKHFTELGVVYRLMRQPHRLPAGRLAQEKAQRQSGEQSAGHGTFSGRSSVERARRRQRAGVFNASNRDSDRTRPPARPFQPVESRAAMLNSEAEARRLRLQYLARRYPPASPPPHPPAGAAGRDLLHQGDQLAAVDGLRPAVGKTPPTRLPGRSTPKSSARSRTLWWVQALRRLASLTSSRPSIPGMLMSDDQGGRSNCDRATRGPQPNGSGRRS